MELLKNLTCLPCTLIVIYFVVNTNCKAGNVKGKEVDVGKLCECKDPKLRKLIESNPDYYECKDCYVEFSVTKNHRREKVNLEDLKDLSKTHPAYTDFVGFDHPCGVSSPPSHGGVKGLVDKDKYDRKETIVTDNATLYTFYPNATQDIKKSGYSYFYCEAAKGTLHGLGGPPGLIKYVYTRCMCRCKRDYKYDQDAKRFWTAVPNTCFDDPCRTFQLDPDVPGNSKIVPRHKCNDGLTCTSVAEHQRFYFPDPDKSAEENEHVFDEPICECKDQSKCGRTKIDLNFPSTLHISENKTFQIILERVGNHLDTFKVNMDDGKFQFTFGVDQFEDQSDGKKIYIFKFQYNKPGTYIPIVQVVDSSKKIADTKTSAIDVYKPPGICLPNAYLLNCGRDQSAETLPAYKRKSQFVITASIYYEDCDGTDNHELEQQLKFNWDLYLLTDDFPIPNTAQDRTGSLNTISDYDPNHKKKYLTFWPFGINSGRYYIRVFAYVDNEGKQIGNYDDCFFKVEYEKPFVSIKGGNIRTISTIPASELTIEAVAADLADPLNTNFLEYEWFYTAGGIRKKCHKKLSSNCKDPTLSFLETKRFGPGTMVFEVKVTSDKSNSYSYASQEIIVESNYLPLKLECIKNCNKWNIGDKVLVRCFCERCDSKLRITYELTQIGISTRRTIQPLHKEHGEYVVEIANETAKIICTATDASRKFEGLSILNTPVNIPPRKGSCSLFIFNCNNQNNSFTGTFLVDTFQVNCTGFSTSKENEPLTYIIYAQVKELNYSYLPNGILLFHDVYPVADFLEFPSITVQTEVQILVKVVDSKGSFVWADPMNVTINPPPFDAMARAIISITSKPSTITRRINAGDDQRALQIISGLLYGKLVDWHVWGKSERQRFFSEIGTALERIPAHSILAIQHVAEATYLLSQYINEDMPTIALLSCEQLQLNFTAKFREAIANETEPFPTEDLYRLARAIKESASNLLDEVTERGRRSLVKEQKKTKLTGDTTDLDQLDDVDRDYFSDYTDIVDEEISGESNATILIDVVDYNITSLETEQMAAASQKVFEIVETLLDAASEREVGRSDFEDRSHISNVHASVQRIKASDVTKDLKNLDVKFKISKDLEKVLDSQAIADVYVEMIETDENPYFGDRTHEITTQVATIVLKEGPKKNLISISDNSVIDIFIPWKRLDNNFNANDTNVTESKPEPIHVHLVRPTDINPGKNVIIHKILIPVGSQLQVHIDTNDDFMFLVIATKDLAPTQEDFCFGGDYNSAQDIYPKGDGTTSTLKKFASFNITGLEDVAKSIPFDKNAGLMTYYIGIWAHHEHFQLVGQPISYSVRFQQTSCLVRDESKNTWDDTKCEIGNLTTNETLHCRCRHLSIFAGSVFIPPNSINVVNDFHILFAIDDNYVVIITWCVVMFIYFILLGICFFLDSQDKTHHAGLTIMTKIGEDFDNSYYIITVDTGSRFFAGTSANVSIQLYGSNGRSDSYVIKDPTLPVLNRGGIDSFLVSSTKDLGNLEKIRLWHDNKGAAPGWYVRKVIIQNIKTDEKWYFYIENWLSLTNEDDPSIIREIPVAGPKDPFKWTRRFTDRLVDEFTNNHLWFSVFLRYPSSNFTRCQRLSCALAVLVSYMLITIMFVGFITNDIQSRLEFGIVTIRVLDIVLSIQTTLLAFPFGFILIRLFQRIRRRYIPTLIIWKNRIKLEIDYNEAHLFVPNQGGIRKELIPVVGDRKTGQYSSDFSIPDTDIRKCEKWISEVTRGENLNIPYNMKQPDKFIRIVDDDENTVSIAAQNEANFNNSFNRFGRFAIIDAIRRVNPTSFIWQGDNDNRRIEELIDQEIEEYARQPHPPWENMTVDDLHRIKEELRERKLALARNLVAVEAIDIEPSEEFEPKRRERRGIALELYEMPPVRKEWCYLPWWFLYIAWIICIVIIIICSFLTILYGKRYGRLRSWQWLSGIVASWVQSVFFVQPLTILIIAFFFSLLFNEISFPEEDRFQVLFKDDGEYIGDPKPLKMHVFYPIQDYPPLMGNEIFKLRIKARRKNALKRGAISIALHLILMMLLFFIANDNHSSDEFTMTDHIRKMLEINDKNFCPTCENKLEKVHHENSFYEYIENYFIPALNPIERYDGWRLPALGKHDAAILKDEVSFLVGVARIRQLRIKTHKCHIPRNLKILIAGSQSVSSDSSSLSSSSINNTLEPIECTPNYRNDLSDKGTYNNFWHPIKGNRTFKSTNDVWIYRDENETQSINRIGSLGHYNGGGYIAEFGKDFRRSISVLNYLRNNKWIDYRTRAIFIEFVVYNPNLNLFVDVVLSFERSPSTAFRAKEAITPIKLNDSSEESEIYTIWIKICYIGVPLLVSILFCLFMRDLIYSWKHFGCNMFKKFWLWADFLIIIMCIASLCVSIYTVLLFNEIRTRLQTALVNQYVSFQHVALWNFIHTCMYAVSVCLCLIKFWKLLVLSFRRFYILSLTLSLTSRFLIAFLLVMTLLMIAFAMFGNMVFGQRLEQFHSFGHGFMELIHQLLGVNFYADLVEANSVLGPIYYFLFGFFVLMISINIFIALLNQGLMEAKEVAAQRRFWLTYWTYIKKLYFHIFPPPRKISSKQKFSIPPKRLLQMKTKTKEFLIDCLEQKDVRKMNEMRRFIEQNYLKNSNYSIITKVEKWKRLQKQLNNAKVGESRMEEMRINTLHFMKLKKHLYFTSEEYKTYANFHMQILHLRVRKINQLVEEIYVEANEYLQIKDKNEKTQMELMKKLSVGQQQRQRRSIYDHLLDGNNNNNNNNDPEARNRRRISFFEVSNPDTWDPAGDNNNVKK